MNVRHAVAAAILSIGLAGPVRAGGVDYDHARAAGRFMAELGAESRQHAASIQSAYQPRLDELSIRGRDGLREALDGGAVVRLVPVPGHPVQPRLEGSHPIGELDLEHQELYVAARPETLGCLLAIASRVRSGSLEVTSLARHDTYQRQLARGNANARTAVPTHVMGLAFDISILNTPLSTAAEIRDVLQQMAADGDLFFVAEQRQLVFHVVPAPARLDYYAGLYHALTAAPPPLIPEPTWTIAPDQEELRAALGRISAGGEVRAGAFLPDGRDMTPWTALAVVGFALVRVRGYRRRATGG